MSNADNINKTIEAYKKDLEALDMQYVGETSKLMPES